MLEGREILREGRGGKTGSQEVNQDMVVLVNKRIASRRYRRQAVGCMGSITDCTANWCVCKLRCVMQVASDAAEGRKSIASLGDTPLADDGKRLKLCTTSETSSLIYIYFISSS